MINSTIIFYTIFFYSIAIFKFDFLNDLYNIEYKKDYFESFPDHKKLIDFIKPNY